MATLQERFAELVPEMRKEVGGVLKEKGGNKISDVSVKQAYGGMRGIKGMICDTSVVEPDKGLIIRGYPLLDVQELWPEEIFYLLLTGDKPDKEATEVDTHNISPNENNPVGSILLTGLAWQYRYLCRDCGSWGAPA